MFNLFSRSIQSTAEQSLFEYLEKGDFPETVEQHIAENKIGINDSVQETYSPLMIASKHGRERTVRKLIDLGAQVNASTPDGDTALIEAAYENQLEVMLVLVGKGADINFLDQDGFSALMWAAQAGHMEAVTLLIKAGADINAISKDGQTALDIAIAGKFLHLARKIAHSGGRCGKREGVNAVIDATFGMNEPRIVKAQHKKQEELQQEEEDNEGGEDDDEDDDEDDEQEEKEEEDEEDEEEDEDELEEPEETWLAPILAECGTPADLVFLCEGKLVRQEGFGCATTLARVAPSLFHRAYLEGLGITGLGLQQFLLDLHGDLHHDFVQQRRQSSASKAQSSSTARSSTGSGKEGRIEARVADVRIGDGPFTHTRFGDDAELRAKQDQRGSHKEVTPASKTPTAGSKEQKDSTPKASSKKRHSVDTESGVVESEGAPAKRQTGCERELAVDLE